MAFETTSLSSEILALPRTYVDDFAVVRPNRDILYSLSVFDLDVGPVTITLPNADERSMSMQVIDEDH